MGNMRAVEMIQAAGWGAALDDHLRFNHFPPVSTEWVPACENAIDAVIEGEPEAEIDTPWGGVMRAHRIATGLHLGAFIEARLGRPLDEDDD